MGRSGETAATTGTRAVMCRAYLLEIAARHDGDTEDEPIASKSRGF